MAIAWHNSAVTDDITSGTTLTIPYTVTSGADYLLVTTVLGQSSSATFSSVTFNGDAMFQIVQQTDDVGSHRVAIYGLRTPDIATGDVVVTVSASGDIVAATIRSLSGVEQTSNSASHRTPTGGNETGAFSLAVTSQSGDMVVDVVGALFGTLVAGANQTTNYNDAPGGGSSMFASSYESATGSSTTMSWSGSSFWAQAAVALVPAGAGGGFTPRSMLLGVG